MKDKSVLAFVSKVRLTLSSATATGVRPQTMAICRGSERGSTSNAARKRGEKGGGSGWTTAKRKQQGQGGSGETDHGILKAGQVATHPLEKGGAEKGHQTLRMGDSV